jgi:GH15 family glucan-1,4-alpha-glucosidase
MLAEQVNKDTGEPFWVIPLAWSHAMFLVFVREALDRKAEAQIWDAV